MEKMSMTLKSMVVGLMCLTPLCAEVGFGPINPKFVQYMKEKEQSKSLMILRSEGDQRNLNTGWIPSPLPEEIHKGMEDRTKIQKLSANNFPERFDLSDPNLDRDRSDSRMTPVKNQSSCGVCWAFAAFGAYEGQLKIDGLGTYDFSEQNLRYTNGTEWSNDDPCSGGNLPMVTAYLVRGSGPVSEADDPYDLSDGNSYNPDAEAVRYVDNVIELPLRDIDNKTDIDYIKNALYIEHRPLYVSMQVGSGTAGETGKSVWDAETKSFYCDGDGSVCRSNHAVVIVGWDDNYEAQGQKGAFIVRNSWGDTWAGDGYFYVPYNDDSIALSGTIAYFEDLDDRGLRFDRIYQHDSLPAVYTYGYRDDTPIYAANRYTIEHDGVITAIGFYATGSDTDYEIKFFTSLEGSGSDITFSNQIGQTQSSAVPVRRGWHTVKLDHPVAVTAGQTLIAQIKLSTPSGYALAIERDIDGYIDAEASPGESYYSSNGSTFEDFDDKFSGEDANFPLKILVDESGTVPTTNVSDALIPITTYLLSD